MPYANKEKARECVRKSYAKHRESILMARREKLERLKIENPETFELLKSKRCEYSKKWRENHPERAKEVLKNWELKNPEKRKAIHAKRVASGKIRAYKKLRRETNDNFRIKLNLSCRIRNAIRRNAGEKSKSTTALIGCTIPMLKAHLESRFKPGMSWENYGSWEIDHVIPCAEFDLREEWQQLKCFNWQNLQPLWKKENRAKSNKILPSLES